MPAPALSVLFPPAAPEVAAPPHDPEVPPPNDQPWVVSEVRGPWPRIVAEGTWKLLYPEREEGPEKVVATIHQIHTSQIRALLKVYAHLLQQQDQPCLVLENVDLEYRVNRHQQPDMMVYLRDLGFRDPADWPSRFSLAAHGPPDWVLEVLSPKTWPNDIGYRVPDAANKMLTYAAAGIAEYWILNPLPRADTAWEGPRLRGFRLDPDTGRYVPLPRDRRGRWYSAVLGTYFGLNAEGYLLLWDHETEDWYPADVISSLKQQLDAKAQQLDAKDQQLDAKVQQLDAKDQQLDAKDAENRQLAGALRDTLLRLAAYRHPDADVDALQRYLDQTPFTDWPTDADVMTGELPRLPDPDADTDAKPDPDTKRDSGHR